MAAQGISNVGGSVKTSGIGTLDHAPQVAAEWLNALCEELDWNDRKRAYRLLRETLHALRDNLPVEQSADLASHMPILIRGLYFEGWDPAAIPTHPRERGTFLDRVAARFDPASGEDTEKAVAAVITLLQRRISVDEIDIATGAFRMSPDRRKH